jgi:hypothetical protein
MSTPFVSEKLTLAIRAHLLDVDLVPPNSEATRLARELTEVVMVELKSAGLSREARESLCAPVSASSKIRKKALG